MKSAIYLKQFDARQKLLEEQMLQKFIQNEPFACKANNLNQMLTTKWTE